MKKVLLIAAMASVASLGFAARDEAKIRELLEGKTDTAQAAWWGFDETDATAALQAAIQSKAKHVIVSDLGKPWIVSTITLASDQEIVFEKGVVVQAKRGAFKRRNDSLFIGHGLKNVTLRGDGATLKMWKADYQSADYDKSEWRHSLAFWSCENVTITGLTLDESGGDGIYLGSSKASEPCRRFVIKDVSCLNHHRQGISVISADGLLIENCELKGTSGTAPQAGIDFEPNHEGERVKDCVMRNCKLEGNAGGGFLFALSKLTAASAPISISIENCSSTGDKYPIYVSLSTPHGVAGSIDFRKCQFAKSTDDGVLLRNKGLHAAKVAFDHCSFTELNVKDPDGAPIRFRSEGIASSAGGVVFRDCVVEDSKDRRPIDFNDSGALKLSDVTGRITVKHAGKTTAYDLSDDLMNRWFPWLAELRDFKVMDTKDARWLPFHAEVPTKGYGKSLARARHASTHLLFAQQGQKVSFTTTAKPVGKGEPPVIKPTLLSPSRKPVKLHSADSTHEFTAEETGAYLISIDAKKDTVTVNSDSAPLCLYAEGGLFRFVGPSGELYFIVPAGVKEFGFKIAGDGVERIKATVLDAAGHPVWSEDNISRTRQFATKRDDTSHDEAWILRLEKPTQGVCEDNHILLEGVPPVFAASPDALLLPAPH